MSRDFSGFKTKSGENWRNDLHKYQAVIEQRAFFYGGGAAKEAANAVLKQAQENCPVDTGHLRNSGRVLFVGAGDTKEGTNEGDGKATGSYAHNSSSKNAYIVSFNTMRILDEQGVHRTDTKKKALKRGENSLNRGFNYAIKIHEQGGKGGDGAKFLERAYEQMKAQLVELFDKANRNIWSRGSF